MQLIERVEIIGNYKSKIEKVTSRTYSDRIAPPRQGGDRRRAFRRWEKRGTVRLQLGAAVSALFAVLRSRS